MGGVHISDGDLDNVYEILMDKIRYIYGIDPYLDGHGITWEENYGEDLYEEKFGEGAFDDHDEEHYKNFIAKEKSKMALPIEKICKRINTRKQTIQTKKETNV